MKFSVLRWLFQRKTPHMSPVLWCELRIHEQIAADLADDPAMCEPEIDMTALATRVIDQCETLAQAEDSKRTRTMETVIIFAK